MGSYEEDIVEYDWLMRDFDSLGVVIIFIYYFVDVLEYRGFVFLGIGDCEFVLNDVIDLLC